MVRDSIARSRGGSQESNTAPPAPDPRVSPHASHGRFPLAPGGDDGACLIEPAVRCNHCGFCQSYGH
jgi:hypothetical protein